MSIAALLLAQASSGLSPTLLVVGIVAIIAGLVILFVPRVLNYVVAIYLLASGVLLIIESL